MKNNNSTTRMHRAKRLSDQKWTYGYLFKIWDDAYILWGMTNGVPNMERVDPRTVGQSTGFKDENGKEIFDGDIVGFEDTFSTENGYAEFRCKGKVFWDSKSASFQVEARLSAESYEVLEECNVIGNIYDNPDILNDEVEE